MASKLLKPLIAVMLLAGGCALPRVQEPLTKLQANKDADSAELEFWHGLEDRQLICNDEAFHGLLILVDQKDEAGSYDAREAALKAKHLLGNNFNKPADEAVQRGTIAVALVKALNIRGGWALMVLPTTSRYATRELVYMNLFPPSSPEQTFSGSEFVGVIGKAQDYQDATAIQ